MMPWIRTTPVAFEEIAFDDVAFAGLARPAACALPGDPALVETRPRAAEAEALAHAATRRRRAESDLVDADYWRALIPQALARAAALRRAAPRLP